jgi:hypothetical protein
MVLKATPVKPAEKQTSRKTNQPAMVIAGRSAPQQHLQNDRT